MNECGCCLRTRLDRMDLFAWQNLIIARNTVFKHSTRAYHHLFTRYWLLFLGIFKLERGSASSPSKQCAQYPAMLQQALKSPSLPFHKSPQHTHSSMSSPPPCGIRPSFSSFSNLVISCKLFAFLISPSTLFFSLSVSFTR